MTPKREIRPAPPHPLSCVAGLACAYLVLAVTMAGCTGTSAAASSDGDGRDEPVPRIVCLSSDAAELLVIIGAGDHVVGVPDSLIRHQPVLFRMLPNAMNVGDAKRPDNEKILVLKPDYVLFISAMRPAATGTWEEAGIHTLAMEPHKLEDLPGVARSLGRLTGHEKSAEEYARFCEETNAFVTSRLRGTVTHPVRVYAESYSDYVTYGNVSAASELIGLLGATSISGSVFPNATHVSAEWITKEDPDFILKIIVPDDTKTPQTEYYRILSRKGFDALTAVKEQRVVVMSGNLLFSPRAPVGTVFLAKTLYPEKFSDTDPDAVLSEYSTRFLPGADTEPTIYPVPWNRTAGMPGGDSS